MVDNPQQECIRKNMTRLEKVQMGYKAEGLIAGLEGGVTTAHTFVVDVLFPGGKRAIEVKAQHVLAKKYSCRMERDALAAKKTYVKQYKLKGETWMAIVDDTTPDNVIALYKRTGFGNYDVETMTFAGSFDRFGKPLGIKFDKWGKRI